MFDVYALMIVPPYHGSEWKEQSMGTCIATLLIPTETDQAAITVHYGKVMDVPY